jgi:hypothetical protein
VPSTAEQLQPGACLYCWTLRPAAQMARSEMIPDGTAYPGIQMMCASTAACIATIHDRFHLPVDAPMFPDCQHCAAAQRATRLAIA